LQHAGFREYFDDRPRVQAASADVVPGLEHEIGLKYFATNFIDATGSTITPHCGAEWGLQ
jgi:hypothetical protein